MKKSNQSNATTDLEILKSQVRQLCEWASNKFDFQLQTPTKKEKTTQTSTVQRGLEELHSNIQNNTHSIYDLRDLEDGCITPEETSPQPSTTLSLDTPKKIQKHEIHGLTQETSEKAKKRKRPEEKIQCEVCGKMVRGPSAMKRHSQTHSNDRPFSCNECGKTFQRNFHLKTHQMIHNGDKKHQCRFCGRLFLLPKDIICHERTHTQEKPFKCETCNRSFTLKSHLTMHIRIHTGERPYNCETCGKSFTQANSLRVHKKTHTANQIDSSQPTTQEEDTTQNFIIGQLIPITFTNEQTFEIDQV